MAQQVAVCSRTEETRVRFACLFAERQSNGAVRIPLPDVGYRLFYLPVCQYRVFPALQDKCSESESVALFTAFQYVFSAQPVTFDTRIPFPDAAIITVVPAAITDFNQSADINPVSEMPEAYFPCLPVNVLQGIRVAIR